MDTTIRNRKVIVAGVMLGIFLAAMEGTILATAMPTIVGRLGGIELYAWVFSVYLLFSTATVPIYGKLSDVFGRKPVYITAVLIFLIGSALCGLAGSMEQLVAFRIIQGIGAGGVQPVAMTIVGDTFAIEERARINGLFSAVWGLASVISPAIGGLIVDNVAWQWIFYVNIPFGIISLGLIFFGLKERVERRGWPSIDYVGAVLLTATVATFQYALVMWQEGGSGAAIFAAISVVLALLFAVNERWVKQPILPFHLFKQRIIGFSTLGAFVIGSIVLGMSSFMPAFLQGGRQLNATEAGIALIPIAIGWTTGSVVAGRLLLKLGYRATATIGCTSVAIGILGVALLSSGPLPVISVSVGFMGLGAGFAFTCFQFATQNAVAWQNRGAATASIQFARNMGGTIGTAVLGALFTARLTGALESVPGGNASIANQLLDSQQRASLPPEIIAAASQAVSGSMSVLFFAMFGVAILGVFVARGLPGGVASEHVVESAPQPASIK